MEKITKLLKYTLQFIIIYLVLKYIPYIKIDTPKALLISLILVTLCVSLEFVYNKVMTYSTEEPSCDTCSIPQKNTTCHVVCDKVEGFATGITENINTGKHNIIPVQVTGPKQETVQQMEIASHNPAVNSALNPTVPPTVTLSPPPQIYQSIPEPKQIPMEEQNKKPIQMHPMFNMVALPNGDGMKVDGMNINVQPFYLQEGNKADIKTEKIYEDYNNERKKALERSAVDFGAPAEPYQVPGSKSQINKSINTSFLNDGHIMTEMEYSNYDYNSLPIARGYKTFQEDYGYSFIPPEAWATVAPRAPVCVTSQRSEVMPSWSDGSVTSLKDFYVASRVTGPQGISTEYINDKLNSDR
jgi:hypothetical protein